MTSEEIKEPKDIMLDIETFGNTSNALVVQVAMQYFNRNTAQLGASLYVNINVEESMKKGFEINEETLAFWEQQPKEVFDSLQVNPLSCEDAAHQIKKFIEFGSKIWCHATFDAPIMGNFFNKLDIKLPWGYKNVRDIRTLVELSGLDLEKYNWEEGKTHNALDDVHFQIKYCVDALNMIKFKCTQDQAIEVRQKIELMESGTTISE